MADCDGNVGRVVDDDDKAFDWPSSLRPLHQGDDDDDVVDDVAAALAMSTAPSSSDAAAAATATASAIAAAAAVAHDDDGDDAASTVVAATQSTRLITNVTDALGLELPEIASLILAHNLTPRAIVAFVDDLARMMPFYAAVVSLNNTLAEQRRAYTQTIAAVSTLRDAVRDTLRLRMPNAVARLDNVLTHGANNNEAATTATTTIAEDVLQCFDNTMCIRVAHAMTSPDPRLMQCCAALCDSIGSPLLAMQLTTSSSSSSGCGEQVQAPRASVVPEGGARATSSQAQPAAMWPVCAVCLALPVDTALRPCGHMLCNACSPNVRGRCHVCRREIEGRLRLYAS